MDCSWRIILQGLRQLFYIWGSTYGKKVKVAKRRMLDRVELFLKIKSLDERKKKKLIRSVILCIIYDSLFTVWNVTVMAIGFIFVISNPNKVNSWIVCNTIFRINVRPFQIQCMIHLHIFLICIKKYLEKEWRVRSW